MKQDFYPLLISEIDVSTKTLNKTIGDYVLLDVTIEYLSDEFVFIDFVSLFEKDDVYHIDLEGKIDTYHLFGCFYGFYSTINNIKISSLNNCLNSNCLIEVEGEKEIINTEFCFYSSFYEKQDDYYEDLEKCIIQKTFVNQIDNQQAHYSVEKYKLTIVFFDFKKMVLGVN